MVVSTGNYDSYCPQCHSVVYESVCKNCGLVIQNINFSQEIPHIYVENGVKNRGPFRSIITSPNGSYISDNCGPDNPFFRRIKKYYFYAINEYRRNNVRNYLINVRSQLNLPRRVIIQAYRLFLKLEEKADFYKISIVSFTAGLLYYIILEEKIPIFLGEIASAFSLTEHKIFLAKKYMIQKLGFEFSLPHMIRFIFRYSEMIRLPMKKTKNAFFLYNLLRIWAPSLISSWRPTTIVSTILFTQTTKKKRLELSKLLGITKAYAKEKMKDVIKNSVLIIFYLLMITKGIRFLVHFSIELRAKLFFILGGFSLYFLG